MLCPCFILRVERKNVDGKMDPIFENPVFDSYLFQMWYNIFSVNKQVRSADEGISVFNEYHDCHNKWSDG